MPITLRSQTFRAAPNGAPNDRHTIGVGELVVFTANRRVRWTVGGQSRGEQVSLSEQFLTAGRQTVRAQAGSESAELHMNVVLPSVRVAKLRDVPLAAGRFGAAMELQFTLTPLQVSFIGGEFRERDCEPIELWGYFERGVHAPAVASAMRHHATAEWTPVGMRNELRDTDTAGWQFALSDMRWPVESGGFQWSIPSQFRIGGRTYDLASHMPQTLRVEALAGSTGSRFRGTVTVWKGGERVDRTF